MANRVPNSANEEGNDSFFFEKNEYSAFCEQITRNDTTGSSVQISRSSAAESCNCCPYSLRIS